MENLRVVVFLKECRKLFPEEFHYFNDFFLHLASKFIKLREIIGESYLTFNKTSVISGSLDLCTIPKLLRFMRIFKIHYLENESILHESIQNYRPPFLVLLFL